MTSASKESAAGQLLDTGICFTWAIQDFCASCKNVKTKLVSPVYTDNWQLELWPNNVSAVNKGYLSLFLVHKNDVQTESHIIKFSLLNDKSDVLKSFHFHCQFNKQRVLRGIRGHAKFVKKSFVFDLSNQLLTDDVLKIKCEILEANIQNIITVQSKQAEEINEDVTVIEEINDQDDLSGEESNVDEENTTEEKKDSNLASEEKDDKQSEIPEVTSGLQEFGIYENLLENTKYSDVTFVVGGTEILAHKLILIACSKIFEKILTSEESKSCGYKIEINDMTPSAFKELLRFIYAGKINDIDKYAKPLLIAAEKYSIERLKAKCDEFLCTNLTTENALDYLNLADAYNSPNLKYKAIEFVSHHLTSIIKKPEFNMIKYLNSDVIAELFCETAQRIEVMEKHCNISK